MPEVLITNFPSSISSETFEINVVVKGAKSATNYLRAELYKDGANNYFGETYNGKNWYGGSDGLQYLPIQITSASASATIKVRVGNYKTDSLANSVYKLRVKRYTASGNLASDTENPVDIQVNHVQVTSTPVAIQTSASVENSTEVKSLVTNTPTTLPTQNNATPVGIVLAVQTELPITPTTISKVNLGKANKDFNFIAPVIFASGLFIFGFSVWLFVRNRINSYNERHDFSSRKTS